MELDQIDKNILYILQLDAKITNAALAQKINLSPAATLERVKKLEKAEIITNYYAQIDYAKIGFSVMAIVGVRLLRMIAENIKLFTTTIDKINSITSCYQVIGSFDFILVVQSRDISSHQNMVIEKLYALAIVDDVKTLSVTKQFKNKPIHLV
ncbi:Lrp/AsnC family transcriptional regulator [Candidatus Cardinium hertigii]|uniref:Lrp/AsnC family transcriptional regulator n=1 Tax=Candidatus Cardinium hertigii TaxID=247481 RepID=A0A3N2QDH5_9BACT|nr:Lrp/AsnC family transcriptional regulator [Candidatus Cardinium hertigii]ROT47682.1 Lrp/AsnC family transcriptional regulator [Candidatus Cardinium hertigii]